MGDDALPTSLLYPLPICCDSWLLRIMAMPFCLRELPLSGGSYLIKEVTLPSPSHPDPRGHWTKRGFQRPAFFLQGETTPWCHPYCRAPCGIRLRVNLSRTCIFTCNPFSPVCFPYHLVSSDITSKSLTQEFLPQTLLLENMG